MELYGNLCRNQFQQFEFYNRRLLTNLFNAFFYLRVLSFYSIAIQSNKLFFPLSHTNSSHTMHLILLDTQLATKHANKTLHQISDVSANHWLKLLIHIYHEF